MSNHINQTAEQAILGICILNNFQLSKIADIIEGKHFYFAEHQAIWARFIEIANEMTADKVTLGTFFDNNDSLNKVGGKDYLQVLLTEANGMADIRDYAKTVVELWQKRELEVLLLQSIKDLNEKSFDFVGSNLENEISGLAIQEVKKKTQHVSEIIDEMQVEEDAGVSDKVVPTGIPKLDQILNGGIHAQQMLVIGARPSLGKTSIAQQIILNASIVGKKCLFISLEVDKKNVVRKFLSNLSSINSWRISNSFCQTDIEKDAIRKAKAKLKKFEIYTNDSSYLTTTQISRIIKNQIEKQPVDLVVIDYIQIVKGDNPKGKNEATTIKETTTALKALSKQYDVAVISLAQINRKAVEGANQVPTINDFKGSGGIEEDADVAMILHRDRTDGAEDSYFSSSGKLIIAKNRHGRTGEVNINFDGAFGRFNQMDM